MEAASCAEKMFEKELRKNSLTGIRLKPLSERLPDVGNPVICNKR